MRVWFHRAAAAASFFFPFAVYLRTHTPTVPFWDSGEFITVSAVLGIPHPPGTPLFVLLGRVAVLLGLAPPAVTINVFSGLASAVVCLFIYLITARLARGFAEGRWACANKAGADGGGDAISWAAPVAGLGAALLAGFSNTFWFSAIEAEVYAPAGAMAAVGLWGALVWRDRAGRPGADNILVALVYLVALSVGLHLGAALIVPGLLLFVLLVRPRSLLSGRLWLAVGAVAVVGLSVHLFLLIRAHLNPPINEGDPSTLRRLWLMLSRDQYQPPSPFVRRAPLGFQLDDMFFRYLLEQYSVGGPGFLGRLLRAAPLLAAAMGGLWQWRRDRRGFVLVGTTLFFTSLFLVFYLNFTMQEVRPRDYFFSMAFQFLPIWAGLGLAELGLLLASSMRRFRPLAAVAPPLLGVVFALFVGWHGLASHDRSRHTFARDLAHNSLVALPRSSILFTNGDNDTFPLWYAQLVEKQRQDVRVVNLALLNTPWYLKQLRDGYPEPAVPLRLTDAEIDAMRPRMAEGIGPLSVADQAVYEILAANAWQRPVYAAMTVPENHWRRIGLGDRQVIEGITLRFSRDKVERRCDAERTMTVMDQLYRYGGILGEGGARARRLDVDPDTEGLVQNYGAAYYAAGLEFTAVDSLEAAARAFERANLFAPDIPRVPTALAAMYLETMKLAQAEAVLMDALARWPKSPDLNKLQGDLYGLRDDLARALAQYRRTIELDPNYREAYLLSYHILKRQGLTGEAVAVLRDLLTVMPGDETARRYLSELEAQGG